MTNVALVTGASRGIGRAIALKLATDGFAVAVNYASRTERADAVVAEIAAEGGRAIAIQADVSDPDAVTRMFSTVTEVLGPVAVLVNNAGITDDGLVLRMDPDQWDRVMSTNLKSVFLCTKAALRAMVRARAGRIINISSISGIAGNPGQGNYAASKAGVIGFTKSVAKEVGSRGITVNAVAPGPFQSKMMAVTLGRFGDSIAETNPLGRIGEPEDMAGIAIFLASRAGAYITGTVIPVDGGISSVG